MPDSFKDFHDQLGSFCLYLSLDLFKDEINSKELANRIRFIMQSMSHGRPLRRARNFISFLDNCNQLLFQNARCYKNEMSCISEEELFLDQQFLLINCFDHAFLGVDELKSLLLFYTKSLLNLTTPEINQQDILSHLRDYLINLIKTFLELAITCLNPMHQFFENNFMALEQLNLSPHLNFINAQIHKALSLLQTCLELSLIFDWKNTVVRFNKEIDFFDRIADCLDGSDREQMHLR